MLEITTKNKFKLLNYTIPFKKKTIKCYPKYFR